MWSWKSFCLNAKHYGRSEAHWQANENSCCSIFIPVAAAHVTPPSLKERHEAATRGRLNSDCQGTEEQWIDRLFRFSQRQHAAMTTMKRRVFQIQSQEHKRPAFVTQEDFFSPFPSGFSSARRRSVDQECRRAAPATFHGCSPPGHVTRPLCFASTWNAVAAKRRPSRSVKVASRPLTVS